MICTLALRAPAEVGANLTLIVQLAPPARVVGASGQVAVCEKSPAFVPATPTLLIDRGAVPVFVTVTLCGALVVPTPCDPKATVDGDTCTAGAVPVPLRATECGLPAASSLS